MAAKWKARARGQMLVLFAVFLVVAALLLSLSFFVYSARRQRTAAEEIARAAVRAGCMQLEERLETENGDIALNQEEAGAAVRDVLRRGLSHLPYGLYGNATPETIVAGERVPIGRPIANTEVYVLDASPGRPIRSPISYEPYTRPFVTVRFTVPTAAFFLPIDLVIAVEDTVYWYGDESP